jgi:hypothetical protein
MTTRSRPALVASLLPHILRESKTALASSFRSASSRADFDNRVRYASDDLARLANEAVEEYGAIILRLSTTR